MVSLLRQHFGQTHTQAQCHYQESKMMFWRHIACLTSTNSIAAHELLAMCVEGCRNDDDTNVSNWAKGEREQRSK